MFLRIQLSKLKYSLAAKASKISKQQKSVQIFHREDKLKSPVLKNVVTKIRNSKKTYVGKLKNLENSKSASSSSTRVIKTALKTKLVSERSMGNKENEPAPEKSRTTVTSNQQPKKHHAIPEESIPAKKTKTVQSSLNSYFSKKKCLIFFVSLIFF